MNLYPIQRFFIYRGDIAQACKKFKILDGSYLKLVYTMLSKRVTSDFVLQTIDGRFKITKGLGFDQLYTINPFVEFQLSKYLAQSKADVFIDVGSFMGVHAIAWSRLNPHSVVYAIEPAPLNYLKLLENVELNEIRNISCMNFAAGSIDSIVKFPNVVSSKLNSLENIGSEIYVKRIDDLIQTEVYEGKDVLIKVDVEGFEFGVLEGLREVFEKSGSVRLVVEVLNKCYFLKVTELLGSMKISYIRNVSGTNFIFERLI